MIEYQFQCSTDTSKALTPFRLYEFLENVDCLFTAYNHGNLVGGLAVYFNEAREAYIPFLGFSPVCQNMGIAKTLLEKCLDFVTLKNGRIIQLEVSTNNNVAIKLYKKWGLLKLMNPTIYQM